MTWRKFFTPVDNAGLPVGVQGSRNSGDSAFASQNGDNYLPEIYAGSPNRILRYGQYDVMDQDPEINQALDTIAEFGTQDDEYTGVPFVVDYVEEPSSTESAIITKTLKRWVALNELDRRVFRLFRSVLKYGDQFFLRDPEDFKLYWVDPAQVEKVIVNESEGKEIEYYYIRNIDPNFQEYVATNVSPIHTRSAYDGVAGINASRAYTTNDATGDGAMEGVPISGKHVIHISLTEGMDLNWPFGNSILDPIYKTYRQKELLEDSVIIYRLHRAPERRVFFIDVGNMPPHKARQYLEQVKNEVKQKRIPSLNSQGQSISDSIHNPMGMLEDYFFAQTCLSLSTQIPLLDGRTLALSDIIDEYKQGKENYVYSQNTQNHTLEPGKIVWADVTRKNTQIVRVTLDNGKYIDSTPDHRFILRDGSEVEARDLCADDSLMPLYLIESKTSPKQKGKPYLRYKCNSDDKIKWVHTSICPKSEPGKKYEIHHVDFNSRNNNPDNLVEMLAEEHRQLHKQSGTYSLKTQWANPESRQKLIEGIRKSHQKPEMKDMLSERNRKNGAQTWEKPESASRAVSALGFTTWGEYKEHKTGKPKFASNHKVVSVEWLDQFEDTGDITIETPSGSHIFATEAGVFVHNSEGRGSKVDTLPGGENLGEIDDLKYFNNKLMRGLRIPSSYLPTGPEDGTAQYNDGKVGVAYIQEYRFSKYVERLQRQIERSLDMEFKMYLKYCGYEIDSGNFQLTFAEPQNFSSYRDLQINGERLNVLGQAAGIPFLSKKFALKKFMQMSDDEIKENEKMWAQENGEENVPGSDDAQAGLKNMNVRPEPDIDIDNDIDLGDGDGMDIDNMADDMADLAGAGGGQPPGGMPTI